MEESTSKGAKVAQPDDWQALAIGVVAIVAVVLLLIFVGKSTAGDSAGTILGPIGDWFGGILNPLIAFLALAGLVKSVGIQRETLRTTISGLESQLKLQSKQLSHQTFFDLLTLRAQAVNSIEWREQDEILRGQSAVKAILRELEAMASNLSSSHIEEDLTQWNIPSECPIKARPFVALFVSLYTGRAEAFGTAFAIMAINDELRRKESLEAELGHVFRATYQTLKFLYRCSDFDAYEKKDLSNYLRAQMSEGEFAIFALTALTSIGKRSRAVSIAFDFYEDRLYSIPWATELVQLFDPSVSTNRELAAELGFAVLEGDKVDAH
jgi:hypothetical protein